MYTPKQINELKSDPSAWQLVQARVPSLEQIGQEWKGLCPFHSEDTPSFTVRNEDGVFLFKCFGCGKNGNLIQFVQYFDNISFNQAVEKVATSLGWKKGKESVEQTFKPIKESKEAITFPLGRIAEAESALANSRVGLDWLSSRGLTLDTARSFHLGFVQSAKAINPHHLWVDGGWIVFPTYNGETITSLKYRSVKGKKTETGEPGFLRKSGMATGLFNSQNIEPFDDVFVVEGEPDCMVMAQAGYVAVSLPSAGFNLTPEMRDRVMTANRVFLAGDMDNPGQQTMTKLWTELRERTYKIEWQDGKKDANQVFLEKCNGNVEEFRKEIEHLKKKALEQPIPFIFDLRQTLRTATYTKPMEDPSRLHIPWANIDSWGAILPSDVMAVSATETGTGKTSWIMNILLENAVKYKKVVVNYSAELSPKQYAIRAAAHLLQKKKEDINESDLQTSADLMGDAQFYNGYKPGANWKEVIELLAWAKRRLGADILVLDHLHFLTRSERDETRAQSEAMRMLKDLAVQYNIIMIVLGQPRKPLANHRGREMVTQDLKGSETFGSDASQVFILHRDRKSNGDDSNLPIFDPVCKVKLDKSRESEPRATKLFFDGARCTFGLLERNYDEYAE
jgi:hypothetical protein